MPDLLYTLSMVIAGTLAAIGYAAFDIRWGLAALLVAGIGWLYDFMLSNGPPE